MSDIYGSPVMFELMKVINNHIVSFLFNDKYWSKHKIKQVEIINYSIVQDLMRIKRIFIFFKFVSKIIYY